MANPIDYWFQKYNALKAQMDNMIEGEVKDFCFVREVNYASAKIEFSGIPTLEEGDKVKLIIVKENGR